MIAQVPLMQKIRPMLRTFSMVFALFVAAPVFAQATDQQTPSSAGNSNTPMMAPASIPATRPLYLSADPENMLHLDLSTGGRVTIVLRPDKAPQHVERVKQLARRGFYNGLTFHRVIEGFMAQTGDPKGTGEGGSELPDLQAEFSDLPHVRGAVSMARAGNLDSANSQFFIMLQPVLRLDRQYSVFGRVVDGMQWVDKIERGEPPANPSTILQVSVAADNKAPPQFSQPEANAAEPLAHEASRLMVEESPPQPR